jgi:hypothetical protein
MKRRLSEIARALDDIRSEQRRLRDQFYSTSAIVKQTRKGGRMPEGWVGEIAIDIHGPHGNSWTAWGTKANFDKLTELSRAEYALLSEAHALRP